MIVSELIEDLGLVIEKYPHAGDFGIGYKDPNKSDAETIHIICMNAFHWDDDKEFFLVPMGYEDCYGLEPMNLTVNSLLVSLKELKDKAMLDYTVFAREKVGRTKDDEVISANTPFNCTGVHVELKTVYFFYEQPSA